MRTRFSLSFKYFKELNMYALPFKLFNVSFSIQIFLSDLQVADEKGDTQIIDILSRHADRATLSIMRSSAVAPEGSFGYQKWQVLADRTLLSLY